ncbi:MAG TPA: SCO family protein [Steroidobacteraceae bacterium]|nr:SCO family protein [Steroidobacteraceae bacterium]
MTVGAGALSMLPSVSRPVVPLTACALALLLFCAAARGAVDVGPASAPRMDFVPLAAGTYHLESIQPVQDARLLDERGRPAHLSALTQGKITLLTFFYSYCVDPLGCPFAHETLTGLRNRIVTDPALAAEVRFVGVSFDPTIDTPAVLERYADEFTTHREFEWRFLTAGSVRELLPVLEDFGQDVSIELDRQGHPTRTRHHMLKVFLIDRSGMIREIYSLAYIQPEVMLNDIRTLYLEPRQRFARTAAHDPR